MENNNTVPVNRVLWEGYLPPQQRKLYNLLLDGVPRNVADISTQLRMCDPRGVIRDLKHSGVPVQSYWVTTSTSRHKMYFIK